MGRAGLQIRFGATETPFGPCWLAATPNGICHLQFLNPETELSISAYLRSDFKQAEFIPDDLWAESVCERIFQPLQPSAKPLSIQVQGTDFQCQVWRKLLEIPFGEVTTYQQLAHKLNRPTAARAIGNVVGRNPIAYVIPCHRVI
ncbi:MAG: methylated-DNA--[protein]-cysteine S-methyltransferase [Cyanobacteria bacterium P01_H01_bin.15]